MTNETVANSPAKKLIVFNGNKKEEIRLNFSRNSYVTHIVELNAIIINKLITSKPPLLTLFKWFESGFMVLLIVINSSLDELEPLKCRITLIIQ